MLSLESARQQILSRLSLLPAERIPLREAHRRFLAESLAAPLDLPDRDHGKAGDTAIVGAVFRGRRVSGADYIGDLRASLYGRTVVAGR